MVTHQHHLPRLLLDSNITIPRANGNGPSPSISYSEDTNFDSNMVIILAALLCALICALGLNTIVRCAVRCGRTLSSLEDPREVLETRLSSASSSALKKQATLRQMPVVIYRSGLDIFATDCHICLGEFVEGENLRVFPKCSHGFHAKCIDKWLETSSSCPTCRQQIADQCLVSDSTRNVNVVVVA